MWPVIIGGVAGLLGGALASLVAPWVNWRIERKRDEAQARRNRVAEWRAGIAREEQRADADDASVAREYLRTDWYGSLRVYLSEATVDKLEFTRSGYLGTHNEGTFHRHEWARVLSGEVDRVAREWNIP